MSSDSVIDVAFQGQLGGFDLNAAFVVPAHGITALFGPSGCGKTTVLRCIAGLHRLAGHCAVAGTVWQDKTHFMPPHRRAVGYVFQEASLFAHLSVRQNLLYGVRGRLPMTPRDAIDFDDVVALVGLAPLLDRAPHHLSGGERQRVAIGRALLSQPSLMLMDEPLSALDRATKTDIMPFLERLHRALALPIVYVTHDPGEVERLADHLVLMNAGRVVAAGRREVLQADPDLPLALDREAAVSLDGVAETFDPEDGLLSVRAGPVLFLIPSAPRPAGSALRLRIAANDVSIAREPPHASSILNVIAARIETVRPIDGHAMLLRLVLGVDGESGPVVLSRVTRRSWHQLGLASGMVVYAQIKGLALASAGTA